MPMVDGKKYAYTKTGMAAAKKAAKKSGSKMVVKPMKKAAKRGK
jgi:succinyl-CoA synthetase beta subunit